jgi:hypothetical protein
METKQYNIYSDIIKIQRNEKKIIGYFHICQKGNWEKSFDIIFNKIKNYGLYDATDEIRMIIVNDYENIIYNERFNDEKIKPFYKGNSYIYERATLLHMKENSVKDDSCYYWYVHSKGISHFNTPIEKNVLDWIKYLLYWNIEKWEIAIDALNNDYDTYGCNYSEISVQPHYSGNFWWAKSEYIKKLPNKIGERYNDPEFWLCLNNPNYKNISNSNIDHYSEEYPENLYKFDK